MKGRCNRLQSRYTAVPDKAVRSFPSCRADKDARGERNSGFCLPFQMATSRPPFHCRGSAALRSARVGTSSRARTYSSRSCSDWRCWQAAASTAALLRRRARCQAGERGWVPLKMARENTAGAPASVLGANDLLVWRALRAPYLSSYLSMYISAPLHRSIFIPIHMCNCICICLPVYLPIYLPTYSPIHPSTHPSIHPPIHPSIHPSIKQLSMHAHAHTCTLIHPSIHASIPPSLRPSSIHLRIHIPYKCPYPKLMHIYIYTYMYIGVYTHTYIYYTDVYIGTYTYAHIGIRVHLHARMHTRMCKYTCTA